MQDIRNIADTAVESKEKIIISIRRNRKLMQIKKENKK